MTASALTGIVPPNPRHYWRLKLMTKGSQAVAYTVRLYRYGQLKGEVAMDTDVVAQFWGQYITALKDAGIPDQQHVRYVRHVERFVRAGKRAYSRESHYLG
jgi:hypothetical protein